MNKEFRNKQDIIETLYKIDYELGGIPIKGKVSLTIFGGSALLLKSNIHATSDIDAFVRMEHEDAQVRKILANYSVSSSIESVMELPPLEDVRKEFERLNVAFNHLEVYLPSTEHLIISKLFTTRQTEKDMEDILESGILGNANIDKLKGLYEEYLPYIMLPRRRYNELDELLKQWKERKGG
ncbi:DUF6036 family nucleotidyltransferase [Salipaludibacillus sp. HK11]|uniref:DUF6036 family nucleotidyltransferase n=1 Tax=Salipaludibacillus sp. HK11 TaxID=3394320 RepID=UPI0039FC5FDE